jgi:hypothetical protein
MKLLLRKTRIHDVIMGWAAVHVATSPKSSKSQMLRGRLLFSSDGLAG